ncbi:carboxylesterase/lipase family protein [Amycolatopsis sp. GM8]|uniref:carboxylesterase/lipase family protein n=1 Tax=Amycolatopsis sp. GM8 TaxID=2896530 RepID=UPI001F3CE0C7|nr:carboxylesterase family protein [Amycolatopsis sp. GM8]
MRTPGLVATKTGPVLGLAGADVVEFRAIPFAGPVGGERRFRRAVPPEPWREPLRAGTWPKMAPQPWGGMTAENEAYAASVFGDPYVTSWTEDGLYLNLWTPAPDDALRPVLVWLHGGGFYFGQPTRERENGRVLSAREDVVIVAPSHRLGPLGYLDTRELLGGDANVGLHDIVLALEWVRDNIAAFGGDPGNVTVFGESGGGQKVHALLAMPSAAGLFHRGVCQSGVFRAPTIPGGISRERARAVTDAIVAQAGGAGALLELPADRLAVLALPPGEVWQPVLDEASLPVPVPEAIAAGASAGIPLLLGTDADEMRVLGRDYGIPSTLEELATALGSEALARHYLGGAGSGTPAARLAGERAITDAWFRMPAIALAESRIRAGAAPVFLYEVRWSNPDRPDVGAGHGTETTLVFGNLDAVGAFRGVPSGRSLSVHMGAAWASFARTGTPVLPDGPWPAYTLERHETVLWDDPPVRADDPAAPDRLATAAALTPRDG